MNGIHGKGKKENYRSRETDMVLYIMTLTEWQRDIYREIDK